MPFGCSLARLWLVLAALRGLRILPLAGSFGRILTTVGRLWPLGTCLQPIAAGGGAGFAHLVTGLAITGGRAFEAVLLH